MGRDVCILDIVMLTDARCRSELQLLQILPSFSYSATVWASTCHICKPAPALRDRA